MRHSAQEGPVQFRAFGAGRSACILAALTLAAAIWAPPAEAAPGDISTVAGNGTFSSTGDGGPATAAGTGSVEGVFFSPGGFHLTEDAGPRVRFVDLGGTISTVAGGGSDDPGDGGPGTSALLQDPEQVIRDRSGNVYFTSGNRVRRISPLGIISTVAGTGTGGFAGDGGPANAAQLNRPHGLALDLDGNLYVGDCDNHRVRRVAPLGVITTVAGTGAAGYAGDGGPATAASLSCPVDVAVDFAGRLVIADNGNNVVRMVGTDGTIATVAGTGAGGYAGDGGPATAALMRQPQGVDIDGAGSLYIAEAYNHVIRKIAPDGTISTVAGTGAGAGNVESFSFTGDGGPATLATLNGPREVSFDSVTGDLYIADRFNHRARRVEALGAPSLPPTATIDSGPTSPGNDSTPTWTFSSSATGDVRYECRLTRGATTVSDWTSCSSPTSYDIAAEPDGAYTFAVRATTLAGTGAPDTSAYVVDRAAPATPAVGTAPPSPGTDPTPTWSFSGEAGATFECRLTRAATVVSDWATCTSPRTFDLSGQPDGTYSFSVRQRDAAGNTSAASPASDYALDRAAPAPPVFSSQPPSPDNDVTPTWGFSGESGATFECRLARGATVISDWSACTTPRTYDLSSGPDGNHTFSVRQTDTAGNTSPAAVSTYVLDTTPPPAPALGAQPPATGSDPSPSWGFTGEAGGGFDCRIERGATVVSDWAPCTSPHTYDLSGEVDGSYTFSVRQTDASGNVGASASDSYALDRGAPAAPSIDSMPPSPSPSRSPQWGFSGEAGATFECRLASLTTVVSDWAACSSPESFDLSGQADDSYTFSVRQTDAAGNTSSPANAWYTLDTTAPPAPDIDTRPSSPRSAAQVEWGFSAEPGAATECLLTRGATTVSDWSPCASPRSYDLSSESDGVYTFSVRAVDTAGQTGPAASDDVELDRAPPGAPSLTGTPGGLSNDSTPTWDFTSDAGSTSECRLDRGGAPVSDWQACAGSATYDLSGEPDGQYRFRARSSDGAGNTSPEVTSDYELDRAAPAPPTIDSGPGATGSSRTPEWDFTGEAGAVHECRLSRPGAVLSDWTPCASPVSYDLAGEPDDTYTFAVRSTDGAGNMGAAAPSTYRLDTVGADPTIEAGPGPVGRDGTPSWSFSGEPGATFDCTLERDGTSVAEWNSCTSPQAFDLAAEPDGAYTFRVRARDEAGNLGAPVSYDYLLDRAAPAAPEFTESPGDLGNDATPRWALRAEAGTVMECSLVREGASGEWTACAGERTHDLAPTGDGSYALAARATDAAGNTSPVSQSAYRLDTTAPAAPEITDDPGPSGRARRVSWAFGGEGGASFDCRLGRRGAVLDEWSPCETRARYDLSDARTGEIAFSVRSRDRAGNLGPAARSTYELLPPAEEDEQTPPREPREPRDEPQAPPPDEPNPGPGGSPAGPTGDTPVADTSSSPPPSGDSAPGDRDSRDRERDRSPGASIPLGDEDPPAGDTAPAPSRADGGDPLSERLFGAVGDAARWAANNADKTGFPLLLLLIVLGYGAVQSRLDGRDPKLALAPVHADRDLEFLPPGPFREYSPAGGRSGSMP